MAVATGRRLARRPHFRDAPDHTSPATNPMATRKSYLSPGAKSAPLMIVRSAVSGMRG
jgi:hypothetical protein